MDASLAASFRNVLRPLRSLGITAESLINAPAPNYALAQQIDPKDARIKSERFTYESSKGGGKVTGLLARPATDGIKVPAAVPYYGRQPAIVDVPKIKGSLLIHYAETDARINEGWPAYEKALRDAGIKYEAHIYPGVNHAFHNDSTPRYDEAAAKLSWDRTIKFFKAILI